MGHGHGAWDMRPGPAEHRGLVRWGSRRKRARGRACRTRSWRRFWPLFPRLHHRLPFLERAGPGAPSPAPKPRRELPPSLTHCACVRAEPFPSWGAWRPRSGCSTQLCPVQATSLRPSYVTAASPPLCHTSSRSPRLPGAPLPVIGAFLVPTLPIPTVPFAHRPVHSLLESFCLDPQILSPGCGRRRSIASACRMNGHAFSSRSPPHRLCFGADPTQCAFSGGWGSPMSSRAWRLETCLSGESQAFQGAQMRRGEGEGRVPLPPAPHTHRSLDCRSCWLGWGRLGGQLCPWWQ